MRQSYEAAYHFKEVSFLIMRKPGQNPRILVADDSEMNRAILEEMLGGEYDILQAENGVEAVEMIRLHETELSLVLLDIVMPVMDGFGVLDEMNRTRWIEEIPVIMISAETNPDNIERAYELGVTDFISRPFDALIVHRRVVNTILLYAKQKKLINLVTDQIYEKEQSSSLMIDILSHIVEFRNGESGLHVRHVNLLTAMFLRHLTQHTEEYRFSRTEISLIATASALHDIGKIAIDEKILNKPGRLTTEEFEIMKTHSAIGAQMLRDLPIHQEEPLVKVAYEICRWHHERYDGRGYPDGLKGEDIPISAQVVSLADVYDALTSARVYKPAHSHEKALSMILNGECGAFQPLLLECLVESSDIVQREMAVDTVVRSDQRAAENTAVEVAQYEELSTTDRTLRILEQERVIHQFFKELSQDILFEYATTPPMLALSSQGVRCLGLEAATVDPYHNKQVQEMVDLDRLAELSQLLQSTTPEAPVVEFDLHVRLEGRSVPIHITSRAMWSSEDPPEYTGAIGKIDVCQEKEAIS